MRKRQKKVWRERKRKKEKGDEKSRKRRRGRRESEDTCGAGQDRIGQGRPSLLVCRIVPRHVTAHHDPLSCVTTANVSLKVQHFATDKTDGQRNANTDRHSRDRRTDRSILYT